MKRTELPPSFTDRIFSVPEARAAGVTRSRMRASDLQSPFRGVRAPTGELTLEQRSRALQSKLLDFAHFSGVTAALIRGVPLPSALERDPRLHVTVPDSKRAPVGRGVSGHAARLSPGDVVRWHGLRISSAPRVWCELGAVLNVESLVAAGDFLIHRDMPHTRREELGVALERYPGRRGIHTLHEAFGLLDDGAESPRESLIRVILTRAGVTGFITNLKIRTSGGFDCRGDLVYVEQKVIIEYQGVQHIEAWLQDMTRKSRLTADGWLVLEFNLKDLENPAEFVSRVKTALALRS
jgi:hypothetical protein